MVSRVVLQPRGQIRGMFLHHGTVHQKQRLSGNRRDCALTRVTFGGLREVEHIAQRGRTPVDRSA